jgi:PKD repeat protein
VQHTAPYPGTITGFSSRGPSALDGNYFPDVMAPGENIRSSLPGNQYAYWSGTSMAGPHVTALIGLMWSACPTFAGRVNDTYQIIKDTATPLAYTGSCGGDYVTGPNNDWGYGTIDALAAVQGIIAQCGPTGALEGTVRDAVTNNPIDGAVVTAGGWNDTTDPAGYYQFPMIPEGTYDVAGSHPQYTTVTNTGVVVISGTTTVSDLYLTPRGRLFGYVTDADNGFPLNGATVLADDGTTANTDATGYYEMYLDEGTHDVTASMPNYAPDTQTVVMVSGQDTQQDFALLAAVTFIPSPLHVTVPWQQTLTMQADLVNRLPTPYDFAFSEEQGGFVPGLLGTVQVTLPAGPDKAPAGTAVAAGGVYTPLPAITYTQQRYARPDAPPSVLLVCSDGGTCEPLRAQLIAFGDLGAVDEFDAMSATPTLAQLQAYDVVVTWTDYTYADPTGMGNVLADYVDGGGRVIPMMFSMGTHGWQMGGRFMTENYTAVNGGNILFGTSCLGTYDPTHPIMSDPTPITNVCDTYRLSGTYLTPGSTAIAMWQDGEIFVGAKDDRSVVSIIGYPGINRQWTGQMDAVVHNAILWMVVSPNVPWFGQTPAAGTVPANSTINPTMLFTATTAVGVNQPGDYWCTLDINGDPSLDVRVTMTVQPDPDMGRVRGYVLDHCTGAPVEATVDITGGDPITQTTTDPTGYYSAWLFEGTYPIAFSAPDYLPYNTNVTIVAGEVITLDVDLFPNRPCMSVEPDTMSATLAWGDSSTQPLTIANGGAVDLNFELQEVDRGWTPLAPAVRIPASDGNFPRGPEPTSIGRAPNAPQLSGVGLGLPGTLAGAPAYAVDVYPGYNLVTFESETPNPWTVVAPLPGTQYFGGDFLNGDFSSLYVVDYATNSLYKVDTTTGAVTLIGPSAPGGGESWTGLTGSSDGILYGSATTCGASTLYTVDPNTGALTVVGPITNGPCIIDIAINAAGEMYGVDIVNDNLIRIDPATGAGTVVGSIGFNANYAQGMDFEEESGVLYLAAYSTQGELRIADTSTGNTIVVGAFPGGAEVDCLAFATSVVGADVPWLFEVPVTGTVGPDSSFTVDVTMDSIYVAQPGIYWATLKVKSNDPENSSFPVYVTMTVLPSPDMGQISGNVYDNCTGGPIEEVAVHFVNGVPITITWTDAAGFYTGWLISGTYGVEFSAAGYLDYNTSATIVAGEMTTLDVSLIPDRPCIAINPDLFEVWLVTGTAVYQHYSGLDITNDGGQDLTYEIRERDNGYLPPLAGSPAPQPLPPVANPGTASVVGRTTSPGGTEVLDKNAPDAWVAAAPLPAGMVRYAFAQCSDDINITYIIGGVSNGSIVNTLYRYDAVANSWSTLAPIPNADEGPAGVCYDGKIYVAGGGYSVSPYFDIYDIATDSWTSGAIFPRTGVETPAMAAWDGKVYLIGGDDNFNPGDGCSNAVNIYDIATDTWTGTGTPMPTARSNMGFFQVGDTVYVVGGWNISFPSNAAVTERYNMADDTWESGPAFTAARADFPIAMTSQYIYAIAGDSDGGGYWDSTNSVWRYDWTAWPGGSWVDTSDPIPVALQAHFAGFTTDAVAGGEVWSVAGLNGQTFQWYDTNQYRTAEPPWTPTNPDVPWIWEIPVSGTVPAQTTGNVGIFFTALNTDTTPMPLGTYSATLKVLSNDPVAGTQNALAIMHIVPEFISPTASFDSNAPVCDGTMVVFTDTSDVGVPSIVTYLWNFGDGNTSTLSNTTHLYAAPGIYTVTLTVTQVQTGWSSTATAQVEVRPFPEAGWTYAVNELVVTFTDTSLNAMSWLWDFGDGITSTLQSPVHTYAAAGTYTVTQTVFNDCGTAALVGPVTVGVAPAAAFGSTTPVCLGVPMAFTNTTTGTAPIAYLWAFGDSGTATDTNPIHLYAAAGIYTVTLDASNDFGASQATAQVEVMPLPLADFTFVANGLVVTFTNASQNATSYLWAFGDGITSTLANPVHTYAAGTYTVTLTVTGVCGTNEMSTAITVRLAGYFLYLPLQYKAGTP